MLIREDFFTLGDPKPPVFHNWKSVEEAKASGCFDYIWETEMDFESEEDFEEWWNSITTWKELLSLSRYFTEVK